MCEDCVYIKLLPLWKQSNVHLLHCRCCELFQISCCYKNMLSRKRVALYFVLQSNLCSHIVSNVQNQLFGLYISDLLVSEELPQVKGDFRLQVNKEYWNPGLNGLQNVEPVSIMKEDLTHFWWCIMLLHYKSFCNQLFCCPDFTFKVNYSNFVSLPLIGSVNM